MSAAAILNRLIPKKIPVHQFQPTSPNALTNEILCHLQANRLGKAVSILVACPTPVSFSLYAHLFHLCSSNLAIVEARKVQSHLVAFFPRPPVFLWNRAIEVYGNCGYLQDAKKLFDEMPQRNGGSWNAVIKAFAKSGKPEKTFSFFNEMRREGVSANEITFACVLGSCGEVFGLCFLRQIHGVIVKHGLSGNVILGTALVDVYGKCLDMSEARRIFDEIENRSNVTWNVIVRRYLEADDGNEALVMFFKMFCTGVRPLNFTFSNALVACSCLCAQEEGMQIHGVAIKANIESNEVVLGSLIDMYVKCGSIDSARRVFDQPGLRDLISWTSIVSAYATRGRMKEAWELFNNMPERNLVSWNAMLAGYCRFLQWEEALNFVTLMRRTTKDIDYVTLGLMLNVCAALSDVDMGKQVHSFIYRHGFQPDIFVGNALLDMYGKCGSLRSAQVWFHQMSQSRDSISWNALLTSYARHGQSEQAMKIFGEMQLETQPSKYTFGILLAACANISALEQGKQIHGFMIRNGYDIDTVVRGALVDMYSKCHSLAYALMVFREAASRDVVLWNSIISACCYFRRGNEALKLFDWMIKEGIKPDHFTFEVILLACSYEGHVKLAKQYFISMSDDYYILPRLEHYECMIELFIRHECMNELNEFVKGMPFNPTAPMLKRIAEAQRLGRTKIVEWAIEQLKIESTNSFTFE